MFYQSDRSHINLHAAVIVSRQGSRPLAAF